MYENLSINPLTLTNTIYVFSLDALYQLYDKLMPIIGIAASIIDKYTAIIAIQEGFYEYFEDRKYHDVPNILKLLIAAGIHTNKYEYFELVFYDICKSITYIILKKIKGQMIYEVTFNGNSLLIHTVNYTIGDKN